MNKDIYVLSW